MPKVAKQEAAVKPTLPEWVTIAVYLLRKFGELKWLKDIKNFVLELVVQVSELLVIAALVISMVNYLTGGTFIKDNLWINDAWAWLQAVAIDAGFGVVLVSFLDNFKKDTKVQCIIYFVLTCLLGFNAGAVTYIDSLASATHLAMTDPGVNPFAPWVLSMTRAIAVVGFLGVSRIHSYDFTKLPTVSLLTLLHREDTKTVVTTAPDTTVNEVAAPESNVKALPEPEGTIEETYDDTNKDENVTTIVTPDFVGKKKKKSTTKIVGSDDVDTKIRNAIKELEAEGTKVTDASVAAKAGFKNRVTVLRWRQRQEDTNNENVS